MRSVQFVIVQKMSEYLNQLFINIFTHISETVGMKNIKRSKLYFDIINESGSSLRNTGMVGRGKEKS